MPEVGLVDLGSVVDVDLGLDDGVLFVVLNDFGDQVLVFILGDVVSVYFLCKFQDLQQEQNEHHY